jgi:uncharacterized protein involved in exopolysaccharide biosynthesis
MNDHDKSTDYPEGQTREVNLFDYFYILVRWRQFIVWNVLAIAVITAIFSLLLPKWYKATASILPPKQSSSLGALSQLARDFLPANLLGNLGVGNSIAYNYLAILQSRTAMEAVIAKFDLLTVYEINNGSMEKAVRALRSKAFFAIAEDGTLTVSVLDKDPQRAAGMANYFVEILNDISIKLDTQEARNNREFIEKRYLQMQQELSAAEDSLQAFQKKHGIYALPEQTKAAITAAAELKSQAMVGEIELGVMKRSMTANSSLIQAKEIELAELNKKLLEMQSGSDDGHADRSLSLFVPFQNIPDLGMSYIRLYRDFEIQNRMLQFIIPLYEQAKIDEQKDVPVVLVLDQAVPPERKDSPKRMFIVMAAFIMSFLFCVFLVFLMEALRSRRAGLNPLETRIVAAIDRMAHWYRIKA